MRNSESSNSSEVFFQSTRCLATPDTFTSSERCQCQTFGVSFRQTLNHFRPLTTLIDPVNGSWMSLNARSPGERSITMAMFIMAANLAGVIGSQLFQGEDGPKYYHGWSLIVGLIFAGVVFAVVANIQYRVLNKRIQGQNKDGLERPENKLFQL